MILQCPVCQARFLVSDAMIPREGRDVRCGRCQHSWFVSPNPVPMEGAFEPEPPRRQREDNPMFASFEDALASATPEEADLMAASAGQAVRLPTVPHAPFNARKFIGSTAILAALVLLMAPVAFYPSWKHAAPFAGIYRAFGWHPSDGLRFSDVAFEAGKVEDKTRYRISGNIKNTATDMRTIDTVRVQLKNREGERIWSRNYDVGKALKPGDIYPFEITNVETSFGDNVATVMMDVGNGYELMVR